MEEYTNAITNGANYQYIITEIDFNNEAEKQTQGPF